MHWVMGRHGPGCAPMNAALTSQLPLVESFDQAYLEYWGILPLAVSDGRVRVAASGDVAAEVMKDLEASYNAAVDLVPVPRDQLLEAVRRTFSAAEAVVELVKDLEAEMDRLGPGEDRDPPDRRDPATQPPGSRPVQPCGPARPHARAA